MLTAISLTLSILEIILLLFGAIILGITIHFFIASNKSLKAAKQEMEKTKPGQDEWKLRYFNDMESREKEISAIKQQLSEAQENAKVYSTEAKEIHRQKRALEIEMANLQKTGPQPIEKEKPAGDYLDQLRQRDKEISAIKQQLSEAQENARVYSTEAKEIHRQKRALEIEMANLQKTGPQPIEKEKPTSDYLDQLRQAQSSLLEQNQKINLLLDNIDMIKENEEMQREILRSNEELTAQVGSMQVQLSEKEKEISHIRHREQLTNEMKSMLDSTYLEFKTLQVKIQKLESQLTNAKMMNLEFEDLKEVYGKISREFEESKMKTHGLALENQNLQTQLADLEDKLRESNFQRQQLQKRATYLEELNSDLQVVSDTNKKLENQLRRVGELESMLNMVSEERDQLMRNKEQ